MMEDEEAEALGVFFVESCGSRPPTASDAFDEALKQCQDAVLASFVASRHVELHHSNNSRARSGVSLRYMPSGKGPENWGSDADAQAKNGGSDKGHSVAAGC